MRLTILFALLCLGAAACGAETVTQSAAPADPESAAYFTPIIEGSRWLDVSAHCGVRSDSSLWCWSWQDDAIAPYHVGADRDWKSVSATGDDACAQKIDGTLYCWALRSFTIADFPGSDPVRVSSAKNWSSYSVGVVTNCGLQSASLLCWGRLNPVERGYEPEPQVMNTDAWQLVAPSQGIAAMYHVCGIQTGGSLWCWGDNTFGQSAASSTATVDAPVKTAGKWAAVATSPGKTCGINAAGLLSCWGQNTYADDSGAVWTSLATAGDTGCALQENNSLWCWGKLPGNGAVFSSRLASGRANDWGSVAVGNDFVCGRKDSGAALCLHLPRKYKFLEPWFYAVTPVPVR